MKDMKAVTIFNVLLITMYCIISLAVTVQNILFENQTIKFLGMPYWVLSLILGILSIAICIYMIGYSIKKYKQYDNKLSLKNILEANGILAKYHRNMIICCSILMFVTSFKLGSIKEINSNSVANIALYFIVPIITIILCCISHDILVKQSMKIAINKGKEKRLNNFIDGLSEKHDNAPFRGYDSLDVYFQDDDDEDDEDTEN